MALPLLGILGSAVGTAGRMGMMGGQAMAKGAGQVAQGAGQAAGKAAGPGGMGKKVQSALINGPKRMWKQGQKMHKLTSKATGVSLSMGAMLKQSQLFTGFLGAIFQVIGAMIDAFLAPMMPTLFKLITWMAKGVPKAAAAGQAIADWVGAFFRAGLKEKLMMLKDLLVKAITGIANLLWMGVKKWFSIVTSGSFWMGILKGYFTVLKTLLTFYFNFAKWYLTTLYIKLPQIVWEKLKEKLPWLNTVEDFITNFVSNLGEGFKSGWDAMIKWLGQTWDKLRLFFAQAQVIILQGLNKIWRVNLDSQVADAQANVARIRQDMGRASTSTTHVAIQFPDGREALSADISDGGAGTISIPKEVLAPIKVNPFNPISDMGLNPG